MAAAAEQGEDPARVGILVAADVEAEPDAVLKTFAAVGADAFRAVEAVAAVGAASIVAAARAVVEQVFGRRHQRAVRLDERGGDVLGAALGHQALREFDILGLMLDGGQQLLHQPFLIALAHIGGRRRVHPLGVDPRAAQHAVDAAAARIGDDDDRGALFTRAAGAARPVLEGFGVARDFDMDDEAERR